MIQKIVYSKKDKLVLQEALVVFPEVMAAVLAKYIEDNNLEIEVEKDDKNYIHSVEIKESSSK